MGKGHNIHYIQTLSCTVLSITGEVMAYCTISEKLKLMIVGLDVVIGIQNMTGKTKAGDCLEVFYLLWHFLNVWTNIAELVDMQVDRVGEDCEEG